MENNPTSLKALFEKTEDYLETRIELSKLQAVSKISDITASAVSRIILVAVLNLVVLLLSVSIALWIGDAMGKMYYGFFIVSGFYCLVILFLFIFRRQWIKRPFHDKLIKKMLN
ncbi:phage holin family protein [Ferruginibacter sp.]